MVRYHKGEVNYRDYNAVVTAVTGYSCIDAFREFVPLSASG